MAPVTTTTAAAAGAPAVASSVPEDQQGALFTSDELAFLASEVALQDPYSTMSSPCSPASSVFANCEEDVRAALLMDCRVRDFLQLYPSVGSGGTQCCTPSDGVLVTNMRDDVSIAFSLLVLQIIKEVRGWEMEE